MLMPKHVCLYWHTKYSILNNEFVVSTRSMLFFMYFQTKLLFIITHKNNKNSNKTCISLKLETIKLL